MFGTLNDAQIEKVLTNNFIGRLGCHAKGRTYIVPLSYAYKDDCIYVRTNEGLKVSMMEENPEVCFEVETLEDMANWQTVIAWGTYKELVDEEERKEGLKILGSRKFYGNMSETVKLGAQWPFIAEDLNNIEGLVFRILLSEKTGRYESATPHRK